MNNQIMYEILSNFFICTSAHLPKKNNSNLAIFTLDRNANYDNIVKNSFHAFTQLQTVFVVYDDVNDAYDFLTMLYISLGRVDHGDVLQVRALNEGLFLPIM